MSEIADRLAEQESVVKVYNGHGGYSNWKGPVVAELRAKTTQAALQTDRIRTLEARVAELEARERWVPVSEPPDHGAEVEVWASDPETGDSYASSATWADGEFQVMGVIPIPYATHWREIVPPGSEGEG